jgi:hypothetical protein
MKMKMNNTRGNRDLVAGFIQNQIDPDWAAVVSTFNMSNPLRRVVMGIMCDIREATKCRYLGDIREAISYERALERKIGRGF